MPQETASSDGLDLGQTAKLAASPAGGFSFSGYLRVPADGNYTFKAELEPGAAAHVWLHDAHLIEAEELSGKQSVEARVALRAGLHPFRLAYRCGAGVPDPLIPAIRRPRFTRAGDTGFGVRMLKIYDRSAAHSRDRSQTR